MKKNQSGVTLSGLLLWSVILALVALVGMQVVPEVIEYSSIKKVIKKIADEKATTVTDVQKAFDRYSSVDNISAINAKDLDITKEGNQLVISFAYEKRIPLVANASLLLEFQGSSKE